ncbi:MAG: hypothetical protein J3Q66DRAFT_351446 [Benniella sp.]|nr:MAG: hypothetical protein J3Q66DRAFT_351446 [Benniella sp.]
MRHVLRCKWRSSVPLGLLCKAAYSSLYPIVSVIALPQHQPRDPSSSDSSTTCSHCLDIQISSSNTKNNAT